MSEVPGEQEVLLCSHQILTIVPISIGIIDPRFMLRDWLNAICSLKRLEI